MLDQEFGKYVTGLLGSGFKGNDLLVLIALGKYADSRGDCHPAVQTIGTDIGCDPTTARAALRRLEGKGLIRTTPQKTPTSPNTYELDSSLLPGFSIYPRAIRELALDPPVCPLPGESPAESTAVLSRRHRRAVDKYQRHRDEDWRTNNYE